MSKISNPTLTHKQRLANLHNSYLCKATFSSSTPTGLKEDFPSMLGLLTRCMAELRGGCGSISNWDGVCPKCWICASVACRKEKKRESKRERVQEGKREAVTINMHQSDGSMRYLTMQANPNSAMPLSEEGGKATGERGALPIPLVLPLPPQPAESSKC